MRDVFHCPICFHQLKSTKSKLKKLSYINKTAHYIQRSCGTNPHCLLFYTDKTTGKIDWLSFFPISDYSTNLEIDYINKISTIKSFKNSKEILKIELNEVLIPDFPKLEKLKQKIETLIVFS